jgi:hypothetical protein
MNRLFAVMVLLMLGGCATTSPKQESQLALVISKCPVLVQYSPDQLKQAAKELKTLPSKSQVGKLVTDYGKLRDACRAITKKLKKIS